MTTEEGANVALPPDWPDWAAPDGTMLERALRARAAQAFARTERARAEVRTPDAWAVRRTELLAALQEMIGPFPERTPLNPRVRGRLERPDYIVDTIIFESRPRFYVTGSLYLPRAATGGGRHPAILSPCGHSEDGRLHATYQQLYASLAARGYVVLAVDPLGQGERLQYPEPSTGRSRLGGCTAEHTMAGNQCLLLGINLAMYMAWDHMRALDYLCERPEVDPARIGVTGSSGGGTATTYLAPLDPRVAAAVPVCYITSLEARMLSGKVADSEQNLTGQIARGLDHADLCALMAPRPLRVIAATEDFFPVEGTRHTMAEVARLYALAGAAGAVDLAEFPGGHAYARPLREAAHAWFDRWLRGVNDTVVEPATTVERAADLYAAPGGQVANLDSETVGSLNRALLEQVTPPAPPLAAAHDVPAYQAETRRRMLQVLGAASGRRGILSHGGPETITVQRETSNGTRVEHLLYRNRIDFDSTVPATLYLPAGEAPEHGYAAALCVHDAGRGSLGETPEALLERGVAVLGIDVRGTGETAPAPDERGDDVLLGSEARLAFDALMLGETLFGERLRDVVAGLRLLRRRPEIDAARVGVAGWGAGGLLALYAAALGEEDVAAAQCTGALGSYRLLVEADLSRHHGSLYLPGVLRHYDLPDVAAAVAPRPLALDGPVDAARLPLTAQAAQAVYDRARLTYELLGVGPALSLGTATSPGDGAEWLAARLTGGQR